MVRKELWTTLLGYNLIRTTAAAAALLHGKQPRQISFTSTCQYVLSSWMLLPCGAVSPDRLEHHCRQLLSQIATCEVANRPGRLEPRVLKRRRHGYKLMKNHVQFFEPSFATNDSHCEMSNIARPPGAASHTTESTS
jgi:hypothetical protein